MTNAGTTCGHGIDADRVSRWLASNLPGTRPPCSFTLIAGGRSNLTYRVEDAAGHTWVLRRPPVSHVLPTAHDMSREHRILAALAPTPVPVPAPLALCEDPAVNGSSFYVMELAEGLVLRDAEAALALDPAVRPAVGGHLADTLAALHAVDVDAVGLSDLARREGYIDRQLRRWTAQFAASARAGVERPGAVEAVGEALAARVPPQRGATVVHGDYRLDNVVISSAGAVVAVLDWELCTFGDPMADLGTFLDYWSLPSDGQPILGRTPASALEGFASATEVLAGYARASGRDVSDIGFFMAFGYWRMACILQGVYDRYLAGAGAGDPDSVEHFPQTVTRLTALASEALGREGRALAGRVRP